MPISSKFVRCSKTWRFVWLGGIFQSSMLHSMDFLNECTKKISIKYKKTMLIANIAYDNEENIRIK